VHLYDGDSELPTKHITLYNLISFENPERGYIVLPSRQSYDFPE
ncbi:uncharacterized protein METZ01_LOCUS81522, partial [marine metagenome]